MKILDVTHLKKIIKERNISELKSFLKDNDLTIKDNKIIPLSKENITQQIDFLDMMQLIKKIQLNSTYGCLLNQHSKFFEFNLGQSTTLTGRCISKHMSSKVNELLSGEYKYNDNVIIYGDTDSCAKNTNIISNHGTKTIEDLFNSCNEFWLNGIKEYAYNSDLKVMSYNPTLNITELMPINYIYRHKTKKPKWRITDINGNFVDITNDHSVMIERDGILLESKPQDIKENDIIISINQMNILKSKVHKVEQIGEFDDEYVYDIGIKGDTPYFFGNNILIHNSCYFSVYEFFKKNNIDFEFTPENVIRLYDDITVLVNDSFKPYMKEAFNVTDINAEIIKCEREVVATKGLFKTKKRYGLLVIDKDGKRKDKNGSIGELKVMGLEIKRSDTPRYIQDVLKDLLMIVLTDGSEVEFNKYISDFRTNTYDNIEPWRRGRPNTVNNITKYLYQMEQSSLTNPIKVYLTQNVKASINWNELCQVFNDKQSMRITDKTKIIICKLKPSHYNIDCIAYPVDQHILPDWFKELPFDKDIMEEKILEKKVLDIFKSTGFDIQIKSDINNLFVKIE